jgi:hypothetical protein
MTTQQRIERTGMNNVTTTAAAEIERHHRLASEHANAAIEHAVEAGRLLLQVKTQLMHGEWLPWLKANVEVSPRQAQRYIVAFAGRKPKAPKCDKASHLAYGRKTELTHEPVASPRWIQLEIPTLTSELL